MTEPPVSNSHARTDELSGRSSYVSYASYVGSTGTAAAKFVVVQKGAEQSKPGGFCAPCPVLLSLHTTYILSGIEGWTSALLAASAMGVRRVVGLLFFAFLLSVLLRFISLVLFFFMWWI